MEGEILFLKLFIIFPKGIILIFPVSYIQFFYETRAFYKS